MAVQEKPTKTKNGFEKVYIKQENLPGFSNHEGVFTIVNSS
jgi:hypothetical protein